MKKLAMTIAMLVASSAPSLFAQDSMGLLEGQMTIATAKGTQLADPDLAKPAEAQYSEYPLVVLSKGAKKEIAAIAVDRGGHYHLSLPAGEYILDVKRKGKSRIDARPFTVVPGQTVRVDMTVEGPLNVMSGR